jgi:hypothetical protein
VAQMLSTVSAMSDRYSRVQFATSVLNAVWIRKVSRPNCCVTEKGICDVPSFIALLAFARVFTIGRSAIELR